jgi:hypothetical protein
LQDISTFIKRQEHAMKTQQMKINETPLQKEIRLFQEAVARGNEYGYAFEPGEDVLPEDATIDKVRAARKALERMVGTADCPVVAR